LGLANLGLANLGLLRLNLFAGVNRQTEIGSNRTAKEIWESSMPKAAKSNLWKRRLVNLLRD
ncbi:MAG: hypothetical protein ACPGLY_23910, partial [Rubripirellula sp.]